MSDYSELKRLAEAALRNWPDSKLFERPECESFIDSARPDVVLALIAEVEALRKDAERWRFFNAVANDLQAFPHSWGLMTKEKMDFICDEAMDAARKGNEP